MKLTKIVKGFSVVVLAGLLLAACGSDKKDDSSASSTKESSTAASSSAEAVSSASITDDPKMIEAGLGKEGSWIVAATKDVTIANDVTVAGEFHDKADTSKDIYRKLALYSQDDNRKVTAEFTLTVPMLTVESENFNIVHGTVKGDIEVKANGFVLAGAKVEGNVTFAKEEYKTSAVLDKDGASVTGEVTVAE